jgi:hypothetical protein
MGMLMFHSRRRRCRKSKAQRQRESATMEKQIEAARLAQKQPPEKTKTTKIKKTKKDYLAAHQLKILMAHPNETDHIHTETEMQEIMNQMTHKKYMRSEMWRRKREKFLNHRKSRCCEMCGSKDANQVHHRTYQRLLVEKMSDLVLLCRECHDKFHKVIPPKKMSKSKSWNGDGHCRLCYKKTSQEKDPNAYFQNMSKKGVGSGKVLCGCCVEIFKDTLDLDHWSKAVSGVWNAPIKSIRVWRRRR